MSNKTVLKNINLEFVNYKNNIRDCMELYNATDAMAAVISTAYTWNGDLAKDTETLKNNFNELIKYIESVFEDGETDKETVYAACPLDPQDMQDIFHCTFCDSGEKYLDPVDMYVTINDIKKRKKLIPNLRDLLLLIYSKK